MAFVDHNSNGRLGYRNYSANQAGLELGRKFGDASEEAPAPAPPRFNWAGPFIGINAGLALGSYDLTITERTFERTSSRTDRSVIIGGQLGYNQPFGPVVIGVESDFSIQGLNSGAAYPAPADDQVSAGTPWLATTRVRVGVDIEPAHRLLVYATGGAAFAKIAWGYCRLAIDCYSNDSIAGGWIAQKEIVHGWTIGGGAELPLAPSVTAKLEYLYVNFGTIVFPQASAVNNLDFNEHVLRAGVNFKFAGR